MQLLHQFRGKAMLVQKSKAAGGAPVVINRMAEVKIGINIGPANLDRVNKLIHSYDLIAKIMIAEPVIISSLFLASNI